MYLAALELEKAGIIEEFSETTGTHAPEYDV